MDVLVKEGDTPHCPRCNDAVELTYQSSEDGVRKYTCPDCLTHFRLSIQADGSELVMESDEDRDRLAAETVAITTRFILGEK